MTSPSATSPEPDDADLLKRHAAGDAEAFGELVRRNRDRMWAVALRTLGDPTEAEDAVQEAFISAFRKASSFRGDSAVTTWLHRIVVNACLDRLRRKQVRPVADDDLVDAVERGSPMPDRAGERELALDVAAAMRSLPGEQRAALVLVDMMGYSVDEAAAVLEVPAGTVKSRCARGRARLAPILGHMRGGSRNRSGAGNVPSTDGVNQRDG